MGNLFESSAAAGAAGAAGGGEELAAGPSRSAVSSTSKQPARDYYLSEGELECLRLLFSDLFHIDKGPAKLLSLAQLEQLAGEDACPIVDATMLKFWKSQRILSYKDFQSFVVECTRISNTRSIEMMWQMAAFLELPAAGGPAEKSEGSSHLLQLCVLFLSLASPADASSNLAAVLPQARNLLELYTSYVSAMRSKEESTKELDLEQLMGTIQAFSSHAAKAFQTYIAVLFLDARNSQTFKPYHPPKLMGESGVLESPLLGLLAMYSEDLQGCWQRLYTTASDGLSFNRLVHHVLGYDGPTCIVIRCANAEKTILGVMSFARWKESNRFYGSSRNILFTLYPRFRVYRSKASGNQSFQWLNSGSYALPHGLGMGGTLEGFRFFIPDTLENCIARDSCPTYEVGRLIPDETFEIETLEVWGCGGIDKVQHGLKAREEARKVAEDTIDKARKVDKAAFFNNSFDREFLLSGTFEHQKHGHDRAGT